jgi:hypothetical protein
MVDPSARRRLPLRRQRDLARPLLTVDYSQPGQVVIFNRAGAALWRYAPTRAGAELNHPSLAVPLPNGDILLTDDYNNRVIVVDPHSNRIVWQYGHNGVTGSTPGYLNNPDGLDPLPPNSVLVTHASTMGTPRAELRETLHRSSR